MSRQLALLLILFIVFPACGKRERLIEVVQARDGGMETADGTPLFGEMFVFNEKEGAATLGGGVNSAAYSGSVSGDLRNTILDYHKVPRPREGITFAEVDMGSGVKFGVFLRTEKIDSVYFDENHVVFPDESRKIAADGPFLDIEFTLKRQHKSPAAVDIEVLDGNKLLAVASRRPDGAYLAKVKSVHGTLLRVRGKDRATGTVWEGKVAVPIKSAAPDLIEYFGIEVGL